jgi:murein endopeptidase
MTDQILFQEVPWEFVSDFATELIDTERESVVNRRSSDYIKWVQKSLNQIMGVRLVVDGDLGAQTRSAIRSFQRQKSLDADGVVGAQTEQALLAAGASPFSSTGVVPQSSPAPSTVPTLAKPKEVTPPAYTLYANIPLQNPLGTAKPMTGIFVPENYCPQPSVDLLVYLHGYKYRAHKPSFSIDSYWRLPQFLLREAVNKSQRNLIMVAPTLGPKNEPGNLVNALGFDRLLDQVMAVLGQYGPYANTSKAPSVGSLILACHSGSGWVMRKIAKGGARYAAQIRECWAFDPYGMGEAGGWADWARADPQRKLYIYYRPGSPGHQLSRNLTGRSTANVLTLNSSVGHDDIPAHYLKDRVEEAPFLVEKRNCAAKPAYSAEQEWSGNKYALFESDISLSQEIQYELAGGEWYLGLRLAELVGVRDENALTNMIFFDRHPERNGRKIEKSEPNFKPLSGEWLNIRDRIVRPFLAQTAPAQPSGAQPTGPVVDGKPYPEVNTPLPPSGPGFIRGHEKSRSYGLPETIQALQEIAAAWQGADPRRPPIVIGDVSPHGGSVLEFKPHKSHRIGLDIDIRLMRGDGREGPVRYQDAAYSRTLTQELVNRIINNSILPVRLIFFNDPELKSKIVRPFPGHDNHLHVRFCAPSSFIPKLNKQYKNMYKCT